VATAGYGLYEVEGYLEEVFRVLQPEFGNCFGRIYELEGRYVLGLLLGQKTYYWRTNTEVAAAIILTPEQSVVKMEAMGFAGAKGLMELDWGGNKVIVDDVEKWLRGQGFKVRRIEFREIQPGTFASVFDVVQTLLPGPPED
jgi:hypothetical protein